MNPRIQQYIPVTAIMRDQAKNPNGCLSATNAIELRLTYDEGGRNWLTGTTKARGYYLSASPVEHNEDSGTVSTVLGSGVRDCLLQVTRRSDRQQEIACKLAESRAKDLLEWCRQEYGLQYEMPAEIFPDAKKRPVPENLKKLERSK